MPRRLDGERFALQRRASLLATTSLLATLNLLAKPGPVPEKTATGSSSVSLTDRQNTAHANPPTAAVN